MAQKWPKITQNGPKMTKMAQNGQKITQSDPKWPKNDPHFSRNFFLTEKAIPQTFSLLECMYIKYNSLKLGARNK